MKRAKGFTLVELLIVIAIILVLISILVPAVHGAWQLAIMLQCQSNVRQLLTGFHRFAADHNNRLAGNGWDGAIWTWDGDRFFENPENSPQRGAIFPYVQNVQAYICPTNQWCPAEDLEYVVRINPWTGVSRSVLLAPWVGTNPELGNGRFSYAMWCECTGTTLSFLSKCHTEYQDSEGRVHRINSVILLVEEGWAPARLTHPGDGVWRTGDNIAGTHFGGCSIGFVDGHVELWRTLDIRPAGMGSWDVYFICPNLATGSLTGIPYASTKTNIWFRGWPEAGCYTLETWAAEGCPGENPPPWPLE